MHPKLQPYVSTSEESAFWFLGTLTLVKSTGESTNGAFGLIEQLIPAGFASPYHCATPRRYPRGGLSTPKPWF